MHRTFSVTVAIPTYNRGTVLIETLKQLMSLRTPPQEILVMDQTHNHDLNVYRQLETMHERGDIRWHRLSTPSIPRAMNRALALARADVVLFLDDDIVITSDLITEHAAAHEASSASVVVGRVRQPWHKTCAGSVKSKHASLGPANTSRYIDWAIACNMSVSRRSALNQGGFDENFVGAAYRFEDEFARRLSGCRNRVYYHPKASIDHLKMEDGGTRSYGHHLRTLRPMHAVGAYYFYLQARYVRHRIWNIAKRPFRSVMTRHHLRKPWWIPVTFVSEIAGIFWAIALFARGPRYLRP